MARLKRLRDREASLVTVVDVGTERLLAAARRDCGTRERWRDERTSAAMCRPSGWTKCRRHRASTPTPFLQRTDAGLVLRAMGQDVEDEVLELPVTDGQLVQFAWHEDRGYQTITVRAADDWSIDAPFAEDTNCFRDDEADEDIWDNLGELVRNWIDNGMGETSTSFRARSWSTAGRGRRTGTG
jgi:hypothetical protein